MNPAQIQRLLQIQRATPSYVGITKKAFSGSSKAAGIKAKCLDCSCWQRLEIANCLVLACPLYPYRPYQTDNEQPAEPPETASLPPEPQPEAN